MQTTGALGIFSGIAVALYIFLSIQFLNKKRLSNSDLLIGFLLISVSLRIAKSIWFFIFYDVAPVGLMFGFMGLSTTGPLLLLSIQCIHGVSLRKVHLLHFIFPLIGIMIPYFYHLGIVTIFYKSATAVMMVYLLAAWHVNQKSALTPITGMPWNIKLLLSISLVWCTYVFQHFTETMTQYAIGAAVACIPAFYLLSQIANKPLIVAAMPEKQGNSVPDKTKEMVRRAFENSKAYLQPGLTINDFSLEFNIPSYLISKTVSEVYDMTFPETVNHFRINEVKDRLRNDDENFFKVENLALETGFKNTSTFYAAFKKETGMSPKEYQRQSVVQ